MLLNWLPTYRRECRAGLPASWPPTPIQTFASLSLSPTATPAARNEVRRAGAPEPPAAPSPAGARGDAVPVRWVRRGGHRGAFPLPAPGLRPRPAPAVRAAGAGAAAAPVLPALRVRVPGARAGGRGGALLQRVRPRRGRLRLPLPRLRLRPAPVLRRAAARAGRRRRGQAAPAPGHRLWRRVPPLRAPRPRLELPEPVQVLQPPRGVRHGHARRELALRRAPKGRPGDGGPRGGARQRRVLGAGDDQGRGEEQPRQRGREVLVLGQAQGQGQALLRDRRVRRAGRHLRGARRSHRAHRRRHRLAHRAVTRGRRHNM
uniref:Uncharacterized protein n=1 Tax=Zea mays TaxID=4577 RepID=A0A804N4X4_MAIZE